MAATATGGSACAAARRARWIDLCVFLGTLGLVAGIELSDEVFHALNGQNDWHRALANALQLMRLENTLGIWVEPGMQTAILRPTHFLGLTLGAPQFVPLFNAIYGLGHVGVTFCFALWIFRCCRPVFAFLRGVFVLATALSVAVSEIVPLAPPRLAIGLQYQGRPFHFLDTVFEHGGVQVAFNEYSAMPSLHLVWALLVGVGMVWLARSLVARVLGGLYPLLILTAVIVTGNHYLLDGAGSLAVVCVATMLAVPIERWHAKDGTFAATLRRLRRARSGDGAARRDAPAGTGMTGYHAA